MKEALLRALKQNDDPDDPDAAARVFASLLAQGWYKCPRESSPIIVEAGFKWHQDEELTGLALESLGWIAGGHAGSGGAESVARAGGIALAQEAMINHQNNDRVLCAAIFVCVKIAAECSSDERSEIIQMSPHIQQAIYWSHQDLSSAAARYVVFHGERCLDLCGVKSMEQTLPAAEDINKPVPMMKASIRALQSVTSTTSLAENSGAAFDVAQVDGLLVEAAADRKYVNQLQWWLRMSVGIVLGCALTYRYVSAATMDWAAAESPNSQPWTPPPPPLPPAAPAPLTPESAAAFAEKTAEKLRSFSGY